MEEGRTLRYEEGRQNVSAFFSIECNIAKVRDQKSEVRGRFCGAKNFRFVQHFLFAIADL
jgi:hypothetical protein